MKALNIRSILSALVLGLASLPLSAQRLGSSLDFQYFFDNREFDRGGEAFAESMTLNAARLTPYITIDLDNSRPSYRGAADYGRRSGFRQTYRGTDVSHRIVAGIDIYKDMGDGHKNVELLDELSFFYDFEARYRKGRSFSMVAGVLPRTLTEGYYSRLIFSDAMKFSDHNVEGLLLKYRAPKFFSELWCDWMGMYGEVSRERFQVNSAGDWRLMPVLSLGWDLSLYHFACSEQEHYVVDNMLANAYAELDLSRVAGMQELSLNAGLLTGYQRDRREKLSVVPVAFESILDVKQRNLGIENTFVYSPDMMVNYGLLGSDLYFGSPFYHTGVNHPRPYDRLEMYWEPRLGNGVKARVSAVCHFASGDGKAFIYHGMQQRFSLVFDIHPLGRSGR